MKLSPTLDQDRRMDPQLVIRSGEAPSQDTPGRLNLLQFPRLRAFLLSRWPQFFARSLTLAGFGFTILAGLWGTSVGSHNFAIIFVWIAWWTALKLVFIPLGGRSWCSVCPIPMPGEWLQTRSFLGVQNGRRFGLLRKSSQQLRKWPKQLRGYWLQGIGFLFIGLFSAVTLTDPRLTAWVLLGLFVLATGLSLVFERRAFCTHLCPIGGFTGIYAQTAPVEVRVKDTEICKAHTEKSCYTACPWGIYPVSLRDSAQCGLCLECLRACPSDNLALNLRSFNADLQAPKPTRRLDEAFMALVMLGSVIAFSAVFLGPWGWLKSAAFAIGSPAWLGYGLAFLALTLGLVPGLFFLAAWAGEAWAQGKARIGVEAVRRAAANQAQSLLPLGLFAWIAFTVAFAFPKFSFVLSVLSDPLGWGWNLLGTAGAAGSPGLAGFGPLLQGLALLVGLFWSGSVAAKTAETKNGRLEWRKMTPVLGYNLAFTLAILALLVA